MEMEQEKFDKAILKIDCYREALETAEDYGADNDVLNGLAELVAAEITASVWAEIKEIIKNSRVKKEQELIL